MGIRTLSADLRPCGLVGAITRIALRTVDFPLLLTPLPAAISLMLSDKQQRLGDRLARTVVVQASSIQQPANDEDNPLQHPEPRPDQGQKESIRVVLSRLSK